MAISIRKKNSLNSKFIDTKSTSEFEEICVKLESTYKVNINHLLGMGTSCIVFKKPDSDEVIKVCSRRIKYFKYKNTSLKTFVKESRAMSPFVLPINELIIETPSYFVYTQYGCLPLDKKSSINRKQFNDIFSIIRSLFSNDVHVGQLRPKNVGFKDDKLVLFDYHSMHYLGERTKNKKKWWHSLTGSIDCYSRLYKLDKHKGLSKRVNRFTDYLKDSRSSFSAKKACRLIDRIIKEE